MRRLIAGAVEQAAGMLQDTVDQLEGGAQLTDQEAVDFYQTHLRGRPGKIIDFVKQHSSTERDSLEEAKRYVQEMEARLEG